MKIYSYNVFDWATCALESARFEGECAQAMLLKGGSPPPPPDPNVVSDAQIRTNRDTSAYNNALTHGNTTTPLGSQTYTGHRDPTTGAMVYDQSVTLAPDQQKLLDMQNHNALQEGGMASDMLGRAGQSLGQPMPKSSYSWNDLNTARQQVQDALYRRETTYLDPQYKQSGEALDSKLSNQGIVQGSDAWKAAMQNYGMDKSRDYGNARDSSIIGSSGEMAANANAAGTQLAQQLALRNEPLNEYNALKAGSQVNIPQFSNPQNVPSANTDVGQNYWNAYNGSTNNYNAGQQGNNAMMGGLMGLGGTLGGSYLSGAGGQALASGK